MESFYSIHDFIGAHNLESDQVGNVCFEAFVEYRSPARNVSEIAKVKIIHNGYQDGQISLEEAGELVAEEFHLDFTTQYQKYNFSVGDRKLLVSGSSTKMGGKYNVTISPI